MTIYKRATVSSSVVASYIYSCNNCGHTDVVKDTNNDNPKCPRCNSKMVLVSSSAEST